MRRWGGDVGVWWVVVEGISCWWWVGVVVGRSYLVSFDVLLWLLLHPCPVF